MRVPLIIARMMHCEYYAKLLTILTMLSIILLTSIKTLITKINLEVLFPRV